MALGLGSTLAPAGTTAFISMENSNIRITFFKIQSEKERERVKEIGSVFHICSLFTIKRKNGKEVDTDAAYQTGSI